MNKECNAVIHVIMLSYMNFIIFIRHIKWPGLVLPYLPKGCGGWLIRTIAKTSIHLLPLASLYCMPFYGVDNDFSAQLQCRNLRRI